MTRWWQEREENEEDATLLVPLSTPTSPRILAKRMRMAGVRSKKLTIRARGRELDQDLVDELTRELGTQMEQAYRTGRTRLMNEVASWATA
jgi:hypothetical protein